MNVGPTASPVPSWCPPPETLTLGSDEVHVWRATLDQTASRVQSLLHTLAPDERARARQFYFQRDREHFVVARGVLRAILSRYLNREPSELHFCYSPYGKPALDRESGGDTLCFNMSHSHGLALYAVTRGREIGIDLERLRPIPEAMQIAERFFSAHENAVLRALPTSQQPEAFFNGWTRKEACLKASGDGLARPLDQIGVSLAPGEPARLPGVKGDLEEASCSSLQELTPGPGYVAALAVEGQGWQLKCWQWLETPLGEGAG